MLTYQAWKPRSSRIPLGSGLLRGCIPIVSQHYVVSRATVDTGLSCWLYLSVLLVSSTSDAALSTFDGIKHEQEEQGITDLSILCLFQRLYFIRLLISTIRSEQNYRTSLIVVLLKVGAIVDEHVVTGPRTETLHLSVLLAIPLCVE